MRAFLLISFLLSGALAFSQPDTVHVQYEILNLGCTNRAGSFVLSSQQAYQRVKMEKIDIISACMKLDYPAVDFSTTSLIKIEVPAKGCEEPELNITVVDYDIENRYEIIVNTETFGNCPEEHIKWKWISLPKLRNGAPIAFIYKDHQNGKHTDGSTHTFINQLTLCESLNNTGELILKGEKKFTGECFQFEDEHLKGIYAYTDGLMHGNSFSYNHHGHLKVESKYESGKQNGVFIQYFDSRYGKKIWQKGNYKAGLREGDFFTYHYNGKLKEKTFYINGKAEGDAYHYNGDGVLHSKVPYKNGKAEGNCEYYDAQGALIEIKEFKSGKFVKDIPVPQGAAHTPNN